MRIDTPRFVLRPLVEADAPALLELREWLNAADLDAVRARLRGWESRMSPDASKRWLNWLIVARDGGDPEGWVQATIRGDVAEVAYAVLPQRRGQGVAVEAVTALAAWLHDCEDASVVEAHIADDNPASQAVARRAGFLRTDRTHAGEAVWEHTA
jgi:RimJ/RimL family protein N-acetyltransferase